MKKFVIYGADDYGIYAKSILIRYYPEEMEILFSDTQDRLSEFRNKYRNEKTIEATELVCRTDLSILIASPGEREQMYHALLDSGIQEDRILKDWRWMKEIPYIRTAIEIYGGCNARCRYCPSGRHNLEAGKKEATGYMSFCQFVDLMEYMDRNRILAPGSVVDLYNWGEPFLNPEFADIAGWLSGHGYDYTVSTNASHPVIFHGKEDLTGLKSLTFSMPGFSQASYDRIHGFCFERIRNNIRTILENFREHGFSGYSKIAFHIYQFNIHEIRLAEQFAKELEMEFYPYFAIPASIDLALGFIDHTLDYSILREIAADLMTFYIDDLVKERPEGYSCQQDNLLTIDEKGQLVLGCCADKYSRICAGNYRLGDIMQMSLGEIKDKKRNIFSSSTCTYCRKTGADYFGSNGGNRSSEILRQFLIREKQGEK